MDIIKKTDFILTDIDEVILEWRPSFEKWVRLKGFNPVGSIDNVIDLYKWLSIGELESIELMTEYLKVDGWFENLNPREDALSYIPILHQKGYRIIGITSCGCSPLVIQKRTENLQRYFPNIFEKIHCLPLNSSKTDILKLYPSTIWVEDNFNKALEGVEAGHTVYLLDMPHNKDKYDVNIKRVSSWKEIYHHMCCVWEENLPGWMCGD